jgi:RNA polymerase sigma factor (sigma-70 family)
LESFEKLADHYEPMIHHIMHALHIYKNKDEYYQHGLIALWEASRRFDPAKGHFAAYAYNYIKGRLLIEMSKSVKESEQMIYPKEEFWENAVDRTMEYPFEEHTLLSYCHLLTPNQRKWFLLTLLEDLSIKEIAGIEQVSISAVKSWRKGAREKLKVIKEMEERW